MQIVDILERIPRTVHSTEVVVSHPFHVVDRMLAGTTFPKPAAEIGDRPLPARPLPNVVLSAWKSQVRHVDGPRAPRKRLLVGCYLEIKGPWIEILAEALQLWLIMLNRTDTPWVCRSHVATLHHFIVGACQCADHAVASRVNKELATHDHASPCLGVLSNHTVNMTVGLIRRHLGVDHDCTMIQHQSDILLGANDAFLSSVVVFLAIDCHRLTWWMRRNQFSNDVTHVRKRLQVDVSFRPDADFAAAVTAQNRTVLDQRDLQTLPCCRHTACSACNTAADDNKIEFTGVLRLAIPAK
ncbi:hypothetical protein RMSM_02749 [Rhodopirellula maiorica SM1]|uniref:Uncharacterized protein n=1 Tax=Rhodopirellula maiorica SM1 TaxID=1265738 RepID=M5S2D1_9BACT|nr:hypothetical protein RMSM_02749 [Rhodopirellula maiorica SM1]